MQRKSGRKTTPRSRRAAPSASVKALGSNTTVTQRFVPAAVSTHIGAKTTRSIIVSRSEVAADLLFNSGGYNVSSSLGDLGRLIHPGNATLFPWLSNIAPCYEKYRVLKLKFRLISGAPTSAAGLVYLAVDSDPSDPEPATVGELMGNQFSSAGSVWQGVELGADARSLMAGVDWRYTAGRAGNEPRTTYLGQLFAAATGFDSVRHLTLEVEYSFEFCVEQTPFGGPQEAAQSPYRVHAAGQPTAVSLSPGVLRSVQSGIGAPVFVGGPAWQSGIVPVAIDIGSVVSGSVTQKAVTSKSDIAPTTLLTGAGVDFALYDGEGAYLGNVTDQPTTCVVARGVNNATAFDSVGGLAEMMQTVYLDKLVNTFAGVRYLAPLITQLVAGDGHTWAARYE